MAIHKDGYVGLIKASTDFSEAPTITRMRVNVDEYMDNLGGFRSLTRARFSISNLDIYSVSSIGVSSIKIEMAHFSISESEYSIQSTSLPGNWTTIGTFDVNNDENGLTGQNNSISLTVDNIPAHIDGYWHKFRISMYSQTGKRATICPRLSALYSADSLLNITPSPNWNPTGFQGMSVQYYTSNSTAILSTATPVFNNTANQLSVSTGIPAKSGMDISMLATVKFVDADYYYALGQSGIGYEFNGISDLHESVSIPGVSVYGLDRWIDDNDVNITLDSNIIRLRFLNTFGFRSLPNIEFADGTHSDVSHEQWNSIDQYHIYCYISNELIAPVNSFPILDNSDKGQWYFIKKIDAIKKIYLSQKYIETTLMGVSRGIYAWFYVCGVSKLRDSSPNSEIILDQKLTKLLSYNYSFGGSAVIVG